MGLVRLKWLLILEALFAGAYIALTRGLFIVYLSFMDYNVNDISLVIFFGAAAGLLVSVLLYKRISFVVNRVKIKFLSFYFLERIVWILMPFATTSLGITILFSIYAVVSSVITVFLVFAIYGSLKENDIRDVTAKRAALTGMSSALGFALGTFLLAFLPGETKFFFIFTLGSLFGFLSTIFIFPLDLSNLERTTFPREIEKPQKIFSTSFFVVVLMASSSLVDLAWFPFVMNQLIGPDYLAASMSLAGMFASMLASLFWRKSTFKMLGIALTLNMLTPLLILGVPWPEAHIGVSVFASFAFAGANFIGVFLFARYTQWLGAAKSSIFLVIITNLAMLIAAPLGIVSMGNYLMVFLMVFAIRLGSVGMAFFTIPEVAIIPEDIADTYSNILYSTSISGYRISIHVSKKTIMTTLRLIGFTLILATLFVIYRILWIIIM